MNYRNYECFVAEFMASLIFSIVANFAIVTNVANAAVAIALAKMSIGYSFEHLTLRHVNPAVTVACALIGLLHFKSAFVFIIFQIIGFICGSGITRLLFGKEYLRVYETTQPTSSVRIIALEFGVSFLLALVVIENLVYAKGLIQYNRMGTTKSYRRNKHALPFSIGAITGTGSFISSRAEGGSFNPAFIFATFLVTNKYSFFWEYMVGDFLGSAAGALVVRHLLH
ncbi:AQP [Enterospora canceri]|uniref:Aquaporin n=1 Tax=Enterospora canceri TaxID=1081671 RepID=A0A1Y1S4Y1_9MICR|nr:AQP [Enterospora canceri]